LSERSLRLFLLKQNLAEQYAVVDSVRLDFKESRYRSGGFQALPGIEIDGDQSFMGI
jgi:hypothetical protein